MRKQLNRYETLVKAHGTYQEFEAAVWNALGAISVDEAMAACEKYRRELTDARLADMADEQAGRAHEQAN